MSKFKCVHVKQTSIGIKFNRNTEKLTNKQWNAITSSTIKHHQILTSLLLYIHVKVYLPCLKWIHAWFNEIVIWEVWCACHNDYRPISDWILSMYSQYHAATQIPIYSLLSRHDNGDTLVQYWNRERAVYTSGVYHLYYVGRWHGIIEKLFLRRSEAQNFCLAHMYSASGVQKEFLANLPRTNHTCQYLIYLRKNIVSHSKRILNHKTIAMNLGLNFSVLKNLRVHSRIRRRLIAQEFPNSWFLLEY